MSDAIEKHSLQEEIPWAMRGQVTVASIREWSIGEYRRMGRWKNGLTIAFFLQIVVLAGFMLIGDVTPGALFVETLFGLIMIAANFLLFRMLRRKQRSYVLTDAEIDQIIAGIKLELAREEAGFEARLK